MNIENRMKMLGMVLPEAPGKGGIYKSVKSFGKNLYYVSGCSNLMDGDGFVGKLGEELNVEQGKVAAKHAMLNFLATIQENLGSFDHIKSFVKLTVFVAGSSNFYDQPNVANGATQLLVDIFGEEIGEPSRSAIGVSSLPGNIPVEIEGIIEMRED